MEAKGMQIEVTERTVGYDACLAVLYALRDHYEQYGGPESVGKLRADLVVHDVIDMLTSCFDNGYTDDLNVRCVQHLLKLNESAKDRYRLRRD